MHKNQTSPQRRFWAFVLPAMASQLLTGFFIIVDGFFIGQTLGDAGLAAINLLWPLPAVILAAGLGIGSGGSVAMATALGRGDRQGALQARGNTVLALAAAVLALMGGLWLAFRPALRWLGADGLLFRYACDYMVVVILLCGGQVFNSGLNALLRGMGRTFAAMAITIYSLLANIFLDWLFIMAWGWGMRGAALATVAAQLTSALLEAACLVLDRKMPLRAGQLRPDGQLLRRIVFVGLSPFGLSLSSSVLIMFNNWQCLALGGQQAVAVYAIVSYLLGSLQPLLSGVGEGAQPLVSFCRGANDAAALGAIVRRALRLVCALGLALCAGSILLRAAIPPLFGASAATAQSAGTALVCAALSLPLWGVVRLFSSCFYAAGRTKLSLAFIFGDPLAVSPLCLYALPVWFSLDGVWLAAPAAQLLLLAALTAVCAVLRRRGGLFGL
ncbi:MAG TPA: polysaccharide biosynthesis C-terminal domain-containing protein [Candidatus Ruthenibacterium merdigallinarum]|nr:polysaccharide biosynthesis C-terminal domain-containing protein [Candidatus Ruthenibacterium merdigallinarum]